MNGEPERMFIMAKNNLGPLLGGFGYSIVGAPLMEDERIIATRIVWGDRLEGTARDLLAEAEDDGKASSPKAERASLSAPRPSSRRSSGDGERRQKEIAAEGAEAGFSSDRLFRASKAMGVVKRKDGFGAAGEWMWSLPPSVCRHASRARAGGLLRVKSFKPIDGENG